MAEPTNKSSPPTPPAGPGGDRDDDVIQRRTFRDYYIILRERVWIALPLALLISIGYGYKQMQEPRMYFAQATMQFEKPDTVVLTAGVVDQSMRSDADLATNIQILQSGKLRGQVIEALTPEDKKILQRGGGGIDFGDVKFGSLHNSFLISVNVTHKDPDAAALVANIYVEQFMKYLFDNATGHNDEAIKYLNVQSERTRKESEDAEAKLQQYMKDKQMLSLEGSQNMVGDALKSADAHLREAKLTLTHLDDMVKQIEDFKAKGKNLFEISFIVNAGSVPQLKGQLDGLIQEQARLADHYLEKHPAMIANANNIAITQEHLDKAVELAIAALYTQREEARQSVRTNQAEYDRSEKASLALGDMAIEYGSLKRDAEVKKSQYMGILNRLNENRTTKAIDKLPLHPLDKATPNYGPVSPNKDQITKTCTGIGILVFIGVAVGLSFIDDRIKSAWDVESFIGSNLLGIIPDLASMKDEEKHNLLLTDSQTPGAEAFLSVYSSIKIHSKLDFPKSILITSTIPGEGKTLISCNVAGSFARHGKKTLLIDCDLRRPMLHRHFKQQNNAGLLSWFEAGAALEGTLANNPTLGIIKLDENLSLLCSGGRSKSPTELLESPLFGQLLEKLKREYDLIIVDSPPLGAVTDSLLIAERTDEVIYVCRFNRAYRKHIRLYMRALRNGKNEVLGIVLNGLSPRRIEYYSNYRYYRSYKKYYGAQT